MHLRAGRLGPLLMHLPLQAVSHPQGPPEAAKPVSNIESTKHFIHSLIGAYSIHNPAVT